TLHKSPWIEKYFSQKIGNKNKKFIRLFSRNIRTLIIFCICFITIISTVLNWGNRQTVPVNYEQIKQAWTSIPTPAIAQQMWTPWVNKHDTWMWQPPTHPLEIIQ